MRTELALLLVTALVLASCKPVQPTSVSRAQSALAASRPEANAPASINRREAELLMAKIHVGMTVSDIREVFASCSLQQDPVVEHGGVWFTLSISQDYYIQFRAARPKAGDTVEHSPINYSPRLRDQKTLVFISGEERPW
jgi:hypothetical protein